MTTRTSIAALTIFMAAGANAQAVYRCGDSYSQAPCPQARRVDVADTRTASQHADAVRLAANERQRADHMASQRQIARNAALKAERPAGKAPRVAVAPAPNAPAKKKTTGKKPAATKDFVAQVPGSRHKRGRA